MYAPREKKSHTPSTADSILQKKACNPEQVRIAENRPEVITQRRQQQIMQQSRGVAQLKVIQMVRYVKRLTGSIEQVADSYTLQPGEKFVQAPMSIGAEALNSFWANKSAAVGAKVSASTVNGPQAPAPVWVKKPVAVGAKGAVSSATKLPAKAGSKPQQVVGGGAAKAPVSQFILTKRVYKHVGDAIHGEYAATTVAVDAFLNTFNTQATRAKMAKAAVDEYVELWKSEKRVETKEETGSKAEEGKMRFWSVTAVCNKEGNILITHFGPNS